MLLLASVVVVSVCAGILGYGAKRIVAEQAAYRGPASPRCVPSTLDRSSVLPGTSLSVSPLPDSFDASPNTQISLLGVPASQISQIEVSATISGSHSGTLEPYSQGDGGSFVPSTPFISGDFVTVKGKIQKAGKSSRFAFHFTVAHRDLFPRPKLASTEPAPPSGQSEVQSFHSAPQLKPPTVTVTSGSPASSPEDIFTAPYSGPGQDGPMIFDGSGNLVWFDPLPSGEEATNLQVQSYEGKPVLTWWQGYIPPQGFGEGEEIVENSSYQQLARVQAGNGYEADLHDFHLDPNNTALLTVFDPVMCDLTSAGGPRDSAVTDGIFQEIDLKTGLVRREWHSLDHVSLSESHSSPLSATTTWPFDYFHINSMQENASGSTLVSARNTWTLYELNTQTGQTVIKAGSKEGSIKMGAGTQTAYQHDAVELPNGTISVFDNGGVPNVHPQSRAILISINQHAATDTLLASYEHPQPLSSGSQGNFQTLPGGNGFIGWGAEPYVSEFSSTGQLLFDARMATKEESYRSYRFEWTATPSYPPVLATGSQQSNGPVTVYASWNGATGVSSWQLLAGASASALSVVASAPRSGFETTLTSSHAEAYVAVRALSSSGAVLATSSTAKG